MAVTSTSPEMLKLNELLQKHFELKGEIVNWAATHTGIPEEPVEIEILTSHMLQIDATTFNGYVTESNIENPADEEDDAVQ